MSDSNLSQKHKKIQLNDEYRVECCQNLPNKCKQEKWSSDKYFFEVIFLSIKYKQPMLKLEKIPLSFMSSLNMLRSIKLVDIGMDDFRKRDDNNGYNATLRLQTDSYIIDSYKFETMDKNKWCYLDKNIITNIYDECKNCNKYIYGLHINPAKTDKFSGYKPIIENITKFIDNQHFIKYKMDKMFAYFVINAPINKSKINPYPIGMFQSKCKNVKNASKRKSRNRNKNINKINASIPSHSNESGKDKHNDNDISGDLKQKERDRIRERERERHRDRDGNRDRDCRHSRDTTTNRSNNNEYEMEDLLSEFIEIYDKNNECNHPHKSNTYCPMHK